ncbi:unnamed protein product [Closterium sp. NIES-65]|nr:unnamed protein product [Closterium sp. NIES-65]
MPPMPPSCGLVAALSRPRRRPLADLLPPSHGPVAALLRPRRSPLAASSPPSRGPVAALSRPRRRPLAAPSPPSYGPVDVPAPSPPSLRAAEPPSRLQPSRRAAEPPSSRAAEAAVEPPLPLSSRCHRCCIPISTGRPHPYPPGLCDRADGLSLFDLTSGASPAPPADADSTVRSQWATRDAAARLAVRRHLPSAQRAHFSQYKSAKTLDHFLSVRPTTLTLDLHKERLLAVEKSTVAVGASRGDLRAPVFEGCSPSPLLPSVASSASVDFVGTESVGAASAPSG